MVIETASFSMASSDAASGQHDISSTTAGYSYDFVRDNAAFAHIISRDSTSLECYERKPPRDTPSPERRLLQELSNVARAMSPDHELHPAYNISYTVLHDNLREGLATIAGPAGTIFQGGVFFLHVVIPTRYPFLPPKIRFLTEMYHPNISSDGEICVDFLDDSWSNVITIEAALLMISSLLDSPCCEDPLNPDIANEYLNDRRRYEETVRSYIAQYATGAPPEIPEASWDE